MWNFRETGSLEAVISTPADESSDSSSVLVASPSEKLLPSYVRLIMEHYTRTFLGSEPLCASLILSPRFDNGSALAFNLFPENFDEVTFEDCMMLLKWLLPRNYALTVLYEGSTLRDTLVRLVEPAEH